MSGRSESSAVRDRYARRAGSVKPGTYSMLEPDVLLRVQERQREMVRLLVHVAGFPAVSEVDLLEVGCGTGGNLLEFLQLGFKPGNLQGIELLEDRAAIARAVLPPALELHVIDACDASIPPVSQDIVFQSVVFSSLLDDRYQAVLARRMWEWVRPGGGILWYDFTMDNPRNPDVRGVPVRRIRELFPLGRMIARRVTLAPPLARRLARMNPVLCHLAAALPFLRTHVLCWIGKP